MSKRIYISFLFLIFSFQAVYADSVRISQIDSSKLLLNQNIKLYISVTDDIGEPLKNLTENSFVIFESPDGNKFTKISDVTSFDTMTNYESGIKFLLLIDNSGSMYRNLQGKRTKYRNARRISHAKKAITSFLKSITNPKDKVGLASYNSYYNSYTGLVGDKIKIEETLNNIKRPKGDEGYSEIYSSIYLAVDEFRTTKGRKVIIILSDGINQPYYKYTGKMHKIFGKKALKYTEPTTYCQEEGISVFAIYFGKKGQRKDKNLYKIAIQTGGAVFNARSREELKNIYNKIVNQILNEYLLTYPATMDPADKKYVKVMCSTNSGKNSATRFYFSSTVFGIPLNSFNPILIIPFLLSFLLLWALLKLNFEKTKADPSIEIINPGSLRGSTKLFTLNKGGKTIIGGDESADMTIIGGVTRVKDKHATILFDDKKKKYTILGEGKLTVNNKPVKTKKLEAGDVINIGGATIVFDDGEVE